MSDDEAFMLTIWFMVEMGLWIETGRLSLAHLVAWAWNRHQRRKAWPRRVS